MAPITVECMEPACVSGEGGARYKTPPLEPGDAIRLLDLHDRGVHGGAESQGHHQGGTGGADTHPPHDTAVWAVSDNSETKTTGHSSDTMIVAHTQGTPMPNRILSVLKQRPFSLAVGGIKANLEQVMSG